MPGLVGAVMAVSAALGAGAPPNAVGDVAQVLVGSPLKTPGGCVLKRDGTVHCWAGPAVERAFDKGRDEPLPGPWPVPALRGVKRLVDAGRRTCALLRSGEVLCFLGRLPPEQVTDAVVELAAGNEHLCALSDDGSIACQGENLRCQLGAPSPEGGCTYRVSDVSPVPGVPRAAGVAAGYDASCAVTPAGAAWCWGDHPWRGPSVDEASFHASAVPSKVKFPAPVRRLALANGLACALMEGGQGGVRPARRRPRRGGGADHAQVMAVVILCGACG